MLGPGDLADLGLDPGDDLFLQRLAAVDAGLERDVKIGHPALDLIDHRHHRRLGDLIDRERGRFQLLGAEPVPGDIDDVVEPPEDAEIAVLGLHGAVAGEIGPVAPVLAVGVLAVFGVIGVDVALPISPDGLEAAGPGVADADVAGDARSRRDLLGVIVVDHRMDAGHGGAGASRFHRLQRRQGRAQEAAGLGLPIGVDDDRLALADDIVIPLPHQGLDRLAHRRHVLEVVVVLRRLVGAGLAQHAYRRRRGVEDIDVEALGDAPRPPGVGMGRHALEDDAGRRQRQGPVDDVGMAGDPADVGHAPIDVLGMDVLDVFGGAGGVSEIAAG